MVKKVKLKDIATYINGKAFKPTEWQDSGLPIVRIQNLTGENKAFNYFDGEIDAKYILNNGDLLISWSATLDIYEWNRGEAVLNQHIFKVLFNKNIGIDKNFFKLAIKNILHHLEKFAHGSTMKHIIKKDFDNFEINLPTFEKQKQIAKTLDKANELIELRKESITKLDALAKSIFIDMFGDPIQNSIGWEVKKLKELSTHILSGNTPKGGSQVYVNEGIQFFRSQNVWKNKIVLDDIAFIDKEIHLKMKKSSLKHKDILMTKTGRINTENSSLGRASLFLGEDGSANINGHVYLIRLNKSMVHEFVLYILTTDEYREYIRSVCVGAIDKRQINKTHIEDFPIIFPSIELQNKFASIFRKIEEQKSLYTQELEKLQENFDALLQKSFQQ